MQIGAENREGETLMENIITEAMHDILESSELDALFETCEKRPAQLYGPAIENQEPPSCDELSHELVDPKTKFIGQNSEAYEEELRDATGMDDTEIFKKRMYLENNFVDLLEYMLEDTLFNLMEEATFEEFDLTQAPKIYIKKEDIKGLQKDE